MKRFVVFVAGASLIFAAAGCKKKEKEEYSSMEGLNGVVSENVTSYADSGLEGEDAVPVIVDNSNIPMEVPVESVMGSAAPDKPTPKQIQMALKNAGFYTGNIDGTIGPKTKKAIEAFQAQNSLKADGKVGPRTWKALSGYLNKTAEVANPSSAAQEIEP